MADRKRFWPEAGMRLGPINKDPLNPHGEREKVLSSLRDGREVGQVLENIESSALTQEQKEELARYAVELSVLLQVNNGTSKIRQPAEDGTNLTDMGARPVRGRSAAARRRSRRFVDNLKKVYQG